jgi:hypothetical protein
MLRYFCATAGKSFDSGIIMDAETYLRERLKIIVVGCHHCQKRHRFLVADVEFQAEAA